MLRILFIFFQYMLCINYIFTCFVRACTLYLCVYVLVYVCFYVFLHLLFMYPAYVYAYMCQRCVCVCVCVSVCMCVVCTLYSYMFQCIVCLYYAHVCICVLVTVLKLFLLLHYSPLYASATYSSFFFFLSNNLIQTYFPISDDIFFLKLTFKISI